MTAEIRGSDFKQEHGDPIIRLETASIEEQQELVGRAFQEMDQARAFVDRQASHDLEIVPASKQTAHTRREVYRHALRIAVEGEPEAFPESFGVQEGMRAILTYPSMLADRFALQESQQRRTGDRRFADLSQEQHDGLLRLATWQRQVANFLVTHMEHTQNIENPQSVHKAFLKQFADQEAPARDVLKTHFGINVARSQIRDSFEQLWKSCIGSAASAHFFLSSMREVKWAKPETDVDYAIDFHATRHGKEELAIQLKTSSSIQESQFIFPETFAEYRDSPRLQGELATAHEGVKRFNKKTGRKARALSLYLAYKPDEIDSITGFMFFSARAKLRDKLNRLFPGEYPLLTDLHEEAKRALAEEKKRKEADKDKQDTKTDAA